MGYIGNDLQVAYSSYINIDNISASFNGTTTSFALRVNGVAPVPFPINPQQCLISVGGVLQQPDDSGTNGFRLSGTNIVFSSAPAKGESFFGVILAGSDYVTAGARFPDGSAAAPSITFDQDTDTGFYRGSSGSVSYAANGTPIVRFDDTGVTALTTGAIDVPVGTTAQRPASPSTGMIRFNTTSSKYEGYNGTAWNNLEWNAGALYYRLNSNRAGSDTNISQSVFGVSVTLDANTIYIFRAVYLLSKTAGATSHTIATNFGGSASFTITYSAIGNVGSGNPISSLGNGIITQVLDANANVVTGSLANATGFAVIKLEGTVAVTTGGTFTPSYTLSAAPGGAYSTRGGSFIELIPIGPSGGVVSQGTWA